MLWHGFWKKEWIAGRETARCRLCAESDPFFQFSLLEETVFQHQEILEDHIGREFACSVFPHGEDDAGFRDPDVREQGQKGEDFQHDFKSSRIEFPSDFFIRLFPDGEEAGHGILNPDFQNDFCHQSGGPAGEYSGELPFFGKAAAFGVAGADNHIVVFHGLKKFAEIFGTVLSVGVHADENVASCTVESVENACAETADAVMEKGSDVRDLRSERGCLFKGSVGAPVIDDQDFGFISVQFPDAPHHGGNIQRFIVGRQNDGIFHTNLYR